MEENVMEMGSEGNPKVKKGLEIAKFGVACTTGAAAGLFAKGLLTKVAADLVISGIPKVDEAVRAIGIFGIESLVIGKVTMEVKEDLDSVQYLVELRIASSKAKKAAMLSKQGDGKKAKLVAKRYTEVKED